MCQRAARKLIATVVVAALSACSGAVPSVAPAGTQPQSSTDGATGSPSATLLQTAPSLASPDLSARPLIWFTPHPPVNLPGFVKGSDDYLDLFPPEAAWAAAASHVDVFKAYDGFGFGPAPPDEVIQTILGGVRERGMAFALELGPLPPYEPGTENSECGLGVEGFSGKYTLDIVRRIQDLGGRVDLVAFDEPMAHATHFDGPNACHWPVDRTAREVAKYVDMLRAIEPAVRVGDIEPAWITPQIGADEVAAFLDAYAAVAGEPLDFFHLDVDWNRPGWSDVALEIEEAVQARGTPFGIIYNGGEGTDSDAEWLQFAAERAFDYEQEAGGRPDHVVLQSWHFYPKRVLPESDPDTFTGLINRYFGARTELVVDRGRATLSEAAGGPVVGAAVSVDAMPQDGPYQVLELAGQVPPDATSAVIAIRVNHEDVGPAVANLDIYSVDYREGGGANLVRNADFANRLDDWYPAGEGSATAIPSDRGNGRMLHVAASLEQTLSVDSTGFAIKPGADYVLTVGTSVPAASADSAYIAVVFLADGEVRRDILPLAPEPIGLPEATTRADGTFDLGAALQPGRYLVQLSYAGDLGHWPSRAEFELEGGD